MMQKKLKNKIIFFIFLLPSVVFAQKVYEIKKIEINSSNASVNPDKNIKTLDKEAPVILEPIFLKKKKQAHLPKPYEISVSQELIKKDPASSFVDFSVGKAFSYLKPLDMEVTSLAGKISLDDSLQILENDQVKVYFNSFDHFNLEGKFVKDKMLYEVPLSSPMGEVSVEVFDVLGNRKAYGRKFIHKDARLEQPIDLFPASKSPWIKVMSSLSFSEKKVYAKNAKAKLFFLDESLKLDPFSYFRGLFLSDPSFYLAKISNQNHLDSLVFSMSGKKEEIKLFRKQTVEALYDLTDEKSASLNETGMIWGKVSLGKNTLDGVKIEISGIDKSPIYFTEPITEVYLPLKDLKSTEKNGLFSFLNVPPGIYALRIIYKDQYFPASLIKVDPYSVSHASFDLSKKIHLQMKTYDFLSQKELAGSLNVLGLEDHIPFHSSLNAKFSLLDHSMMINFYPEKKEHLAFRWIADPFNSFAKIPVFSRDWMHSLSSFSLEHTGSIVGLFSEKNIFNFRILSDLKQDLSENLIFFDAQGNKVSHPQEKGGFLIHHLAPGLYSILLESSKGIYQKIIPVEQTHLFYTVF